MFLRLFSYRALAVPICLLFASMFPAASQTPQQIGNTAEHKATPPAFEVASIRPVPAGREGLISIGPYGVSRFTARNMPLTMLIELAYNVDGQSIVGQPKHIDSTLFDVDAKTEADIPLNYKLLQPLLQELLEQRFGLKVHRETKVRPGYALVVAKGGPRLKGTNTPAEDSYIVPDQMQGAQLHDASVSMSSLATIISQIVHRPVIDKTGLSGNYDLTLSYALEDATDSTSPSIYTALKEQLGLQLQPKKMPVEMLMIDSVNEMPTEN